MPRKPAPPPDDTDPARRHRPSENFPGSDYTPHEAAALRAVDAYRRRTGRRFPSVTEVMQILVNLGWTPPPEDK